jgi:competence ComEA-like helix-hairpin-helix protein
VNFKKVAHKIGFTEKELKVVLFLSLALVASLVLRTLNYNSGSDNQKYDYSKQDSLFYSYDSLKEKKDTAFIEKKVDSKQELLDFSKNKSKIKNDSRNSGKIININKASAKEFTQLPGIGIKTAERIIAKRNELKRFKSTKDLLKVKGIGKKKFSQIKKFLIIK